MGTYCVRVVLAVDIIQSHVSSLSLTYMYSSLCPCTSSESSSEYISQEAGLLRRRAPRVRAESVFLDVLCVVSPTPAVMHRP
jgi:hypothetical protein